MSTREWLSSRPTALFNELVAWLLKAAPDPAPPVLKMLTVEAYIKWAVADNFVETGTHEGITTGFMAPLVKRAISIELAPQYHEKAKLFLAEYPNIELHLGDSADLMPSIVASLQGVSVYWLDGHYSGGQTALGHRVSPLLEEIVAIFTHGEDNAVILIDDVRLFDGVEYPGLDTIHQIADYYWPGAQIEVLHDILRVVPAKLAPMISAARAASEMSSFI